LLFAIAEIAASFALKTGSKWEICDKNQSVATATITTFATFTTYRRHRRRHKSQSHSFCLTTGD
jgi:hypothetical protein